MAHVSEADQREKGSIKVELGRCGTSLPGQKRESQSLWRSMSQENPRISLDFLQTRGEVALQAGGD